ncbi:MAG: folylpolyglutamate synthase/dihydrofolate synthase family protein [Trueperaceae bacterium]|nr:folylpolyglutamate synthase/dihydrofolate synthase family protein [Trueperaceae bacterium]
MSDGAATARLFALQRFGVVPGLERTRALLARLGHPQRAFDAVLVAGTNGKGATVAHLDAMVRAEGRSVGRFVSPHLASPGERVTVGGSPMSDEAFDDAVAEILPHAEAVGATFFEALTALACVRFAKAGVDVAVMEVGLGGRLDATNALEPVAGAITSIALDHQAVLGSSLTAIAREKAGILRRGVPAWSSARGEAADALRAAAHEIGAPLRFLGRDADVHVRSHGWAGSTVSVGREGRSELVLATPLVGRHQAQNAALAACVAGELGVSDRSVAEGARATRWPGRLEAVGPRDGADPRWPLPDGVRLLLDGAHNPAAAKALADTLSELGERPALVFGASRDKDVAGVLSELAPHISSLFLTRATLSPRALPPREAAALATSLGLSVAGVHDDPRDAVSAAAHDRTSGSVLVAGSLYLIGEIRPWLLGQPVPGWERWQ